MLNHLYDRNNFVLQTVNQGVKAEWKIKVDGEKPITCAWFKDGTKMKSSRNIKMTFLRGEAKLTVMEAMADDEAEYRCDATNKHGVTSKSTKLTVIGQCNLLHIYYQCCFHIDLCILLSNSTVDLHIWLSQSHISLPF